jgi:ketosteroid isomerase-like protein
MSHIRQVAESFVQKISDGEVIEAIDLLEETGTYWALSYGEMRMSGMKAFLSEALVRVPMTFTVHDGLVQEDRVALEVESYAETANGIYNNHYCFIMTVRGEKIVRVKEYTDIDHANRVLVPLLTDLAPLLQQS